MTIADTPISPKQTDADAPATIVVPDLPDPLLSEAYEKAAIKSVLAAVNNEVFFGYFSVCADGQGHGGDTTFPGLDWGQSAEALLWLGRDDLVRASWDYVKSFQRADGHLPFAILPSHAGQTLKIDTDFPLEIAANGGAYTHWVPGAPFRTLAPVTYLQMADAMARRLGDGRWLAAQAESLRRVVAYLETLVDARGLVAGAGYYLERPTRIEFDGVTQCYTAHAFGLAADLFDATGDAPMAARCRDLAGRITAGFRQHFWAGDHCVEYIHPQRGAIASHGLTDVDWIAVATGMISPQQIAELWPRLRSDPDFDFDGVPTGIATRPETYEDWEMQNIDRHDLSAMGRVWYLESWARRAMNDGDGLVASIRKVAEVGRRNDWYWMERYYSQRTGDLSAARIHQYVEYPANLIRVVQRFLLGVAFELDGSLQLSPTVPASWYAGDGFGQTLAWQGRTLTYRFHGETISGSYQGPTPLRIRIGTRSATTDLPASGDRTMNFAQPV